MEWLSLLIGALGIVIGYIASHQVTNKQIVKLVEQLETARRQLDVDAVGMTSHELESIDEILIQHPKFRPCFYDGIEPHELGTLTNNEKEMIKAIAARLVNGYATILLQSRAKLEDETLLPAAWARITIARRYGNSPACCDHLMTYIEEYSYTGRHQLALMFDGLNEASNAASERNDKKRMKQLKTRIQAAEDQEASLHERLDKSNSKYEGREMPVAT